IVVNSVNPQGTFRSITEAASQKGLERAESRLAQQAADAARSATIKAEGEAFAARQATEKARLVGLRTASTAAEGAAEGALEGTGAEAGAIAGLVLADAAVIWAANSILQTEIWRLTHNGELPPCGSFLPDALKAITACDDAPLVTGPTIATATTIRIGPHDPNELFGPGGFGPQQFVQPNALFPYIVYFENDPHATAPAQQVVVTEQLDPNLDWSTFELRTSGFGDVRVQIPSGRQVYHTRLDERASLGLFIDFDASFNPVTGVVTWTLTSLDPATLDIPIDVLSGFLPPDDATGRGQGFVTYFIRPKAQAPTGTPITAQAAVVFDNNAPIATPPFTNTIDAGPPTSNVQPLPATTTATSFPVTW